ncbi:MAG: hypothetical protein RL021_1798 [Bacteroidota bacterium]|jgi:copper chaperone CopZ
MKKAVATWLAILFSVAFLSAQTATVNIRTSAVCETCKETIEKDLSFEKGVKSAILTVDTKMLTVVYDSTRTSADKIRLRVSKIGYDADDVKRDPKAFKRLPECCKQKECSHH